MQSIRGFFLCLSHYFLCTLFSCSCCLVELEGFLPLNWQTQLSSLPLYLFCLELLIAAYRPARPENRAATPGSSNSSTSSSSPTPSPSSSSSSRHPTLVSLIPQIVAHLQGMITSLVASFANQQNAPPEVSTAILSAMLQLLQLPPIARTLTVQHWLHVLSSVHRLLPTIPSLRTPLLECMIVASSCKLPAEAVQSLLQQCFQPYFHTLLAHPSPSLDSTAAAAARADQLASFDAFYRLTHWASPLWRPHIKSLIPVDVHPSLVEYAKRRGKEAPERVLPSERPLCRELSTSQTPGTAPLSPEEVKKRLQRECDSAQQRSEAILAQRTADASSTDAMRYRQLLLQRETASNLHAAHWLDQAQAEIDASSAATNATADDTPAPFSWSQQL